MSAVHGRRARGRTHGTIHHLGTALLAFGIALGVIRAARYALRILGAALDLSENQATLVVIAQIAGYGSAAALEVAIVVAGIWLAVRARGRTRLAGIAAAITAVVLPLVGFVLFPVQEAAIGSAGTADGARSIPGAFDALGIVLSLVAAGVVIACGILARRGDGRAQDTMSAVT